MDLRFAIPRVDGRGAGLGNELIVWAKAFIGAQALGLRLLHPAWGLNRRNYRRYFRTSRLDWASQKLLRMSLPAYEFEETDYRSSPNLDLHTAILAYGEKHGLRHQHAFTLSFSGLWGGFRELRSARQYLLSQLLPTTGTIRNLYEIDRRFEADALRVGLHIRRGDFTAPVENYSGRFNVAIGLEWYLAIARELQRAFGSKVSFLVVSDAEEEDLIDLTRQFRCVTTGDMDFRDISDLLALSACDFIVCSISSFSAWAALLSTGRYGWYSPQLTSKNGYVSIWGHEAFQASPRGETARSAESMDASGSSVVRPRGVPIASDGSLPSELLDDLSRTLSLKSVHSDLIQYGVVREASS